MPITKFKVSLTFKAPILTQASGSIGFGLDTAMLKEDNKPVLSGSLVKGNILHALNDIQEITNVPTQDNLNLWFGKEANTKFEPNVAILQFDEYWQDKSYSDNPGVAERYRIAVNDKGSVENGALQVIESLYPANKEVTFSGNISVLKADNENEIEKWLNKALALIPAMGALKTNGFGKLIKAVVAKETSNELGTQNSTFNKVFGLSLKPISSSCFAKPAIGENNHFETHDFIPASAIKASIAHQMAKDSLLSENLDKIYITNALPVKNNGTKRSVALPLTIVSTYKGETINLHDISKISKSKLIDNQAPTFQTDWKPKTFEECNKLVNPLNQGDAPNKKLKIRTAINADTGTAKGSNLFSMETVIPDNFNWLCNIDISKIKDEEQCEVFEQLSQIMENDLHQLGKTKASTKATLLDKINYECKQMEVTNGDKQVIIYLQSPARLIPSKFKCEPTNNGDELYKAYTKTWQELSDKSLELSHFYASQQLEGGEHWWHRFRKNHTKDNYHPEIFTQAGSVFVLNVKDNKKAKEKIKMWQQFGLPQIDDNSGGEDWQQNPWIATNGYGEIAVNLKFDEAIKEITND